MSEGGITTGTGLTGTNLQGQGAYQKQGRNPHRIAALRNALAERLGVEWDKLAHLLTTRLQKADDAPEDQADDLLAALAEVDAWDSLAYGIPGGNVQHALEAAYLDGAHDAQLQVGLRWGLPAPSAKAYAKHRAAEMVGKTWQGAQLIDNPHARWAIDAHTRDTLRRAIIHALEDNIPRSALKTYLEAHPAFPGLFGEYRADMIARTELAMAHNVGAAQTYQHAGLHWTRVLDNPACAICKEWAGTLQTLTWAQDNPLGHPHCIRAFSPVQDDDPTLQGLEPISKAIAVRNPGLGMPYHQDRQVARIEFAPIPAPHPAWVHPDHTMEDDHEA